MQVYISYQEVHQLSRSVSQQAKAFKPDLIVTIGGGGLIPARIMRTILQVPILVVTAESYTDKEQHGLSWRQWLDKPADLENKRVLLVDELDDTGRTLEATYKRLLECKPADLAIAVLHYKDKPKKGHLPSDLTFYKGATVSDQWIVYPWESEE